MPPLPPSSYQLGKADVQKRAKLDAEMKAKVAPPAVFRTRAGGRKIRCHHSTGRRQASSWGKPDLEGPGAGGDVVGGNQPNPGHVCADDCNDSLVLSRHCIMLGLGWEDPRQG